MTSKNKQKGNRSELEFAHLIGGKRVPLSGAAGGEFTGDVIGPDGTVWELKRRMGAQGFAMLYRWLTRVDALAVRGDRKEWLVVMPLTTYQEKFDFKINNGQGANPEA